jgi:hypothetical protein
VGGSPIYAALIDSVPFQSLLSDLSLTLGEFGSAAVIDSFGLPGLTTAGPGVTSSMGIQLRFSLSPGDAASILSTFTVEPGSSRVPDTGHTAARFPGQPLYNDAGCLRQARAGTHSCAHPAIGGTRKLSVPGRVPSEFFTVTTGRGDLHRCSLRLHISVWIPQTFGSSYPLRRGRSSIELARALFLNSSLTAPSTRLGTTENPATPAAPVPASSLIALGRDIFIALFLSLRLRIARFCSLVLGASPKGRPPTRLASRLLGS